MPLLFLLGIVTTTVTSVTKRDKTYAILLFQP